MSYLARHPRELAGAAARRVRRRLDTSAPRCLVCGSTDLREQVVERAAPLPRPGRYELRICQTCQYVSNPGNTVDYTAFTSVERFKLTPRVGTEDHQGREFHMARMGADVLQRSSLDVMVFGAGRSLDYRHIAKLPQVRSVVMSDVVDLGVDADFINITEGTDRRFDLIIACEVVEHFTDPATEFPRLFDLLTKDGLLVCSTNIFNGGDLQKQRYLYSPGHVSYYSPRAIRRIAERNRMRFDFRLPAIANGSPGPRKRYVLFTRSARNLRNVAEYFGGRPYAPSEDVRAMEEAGARSG
ncbi:MULTISPECIES: class I SAM-dependent methyltransferase [Nocardioides]|uniref:Class I SAM-dependent methyltransferase n=1 Tax=Nocardioides vastitatis TaxID=2568655 RepID=A0ABW0ZFC1_9ACTN|nr:methyltransferase domain-containing protein [Nocardioides sp.]